jgi:hypothetical protein
MDEKQLLAEIGLLKQQMVAVSTGGPRIQTVNDEYKDRWRGVHDELESRGIEDPNPHDDLWKWYGKWSGGDLPTYQTRRRYVADLYDELERVLRSRRQGQSRPVPLTGWARVDRGINKARDQLATAAEAEDFQRVGLLCRETLISLAQAVYDPAKHPATDDVVPSETDAKRMLDAYIAVELKGGSDEAARRHARASLQLADALVHRRTATLRDAAMCAEATTSLINLVAIVDGRRLEDPGIEMPGRTASHAADKALFAQFKAALPSKGTISFISQHSMGYSFKRDALRELDDFVYAWDDADHEFMEPELERLRKVLRTAADEYLMYLSLNTWPIDQERQGVPAEWEETQPKRFRETIDRLHELAAQVVGAHQELIRVGRRLLEA